MLNRHFILLRYFGIFILFLNISLSSNAAVFRSVQTGDWDDASTWRLGAGAGGTAGIDFPSPMDNVFISDGDTVYIDFGTTGTLYEYQGTMNVDTAGLLWVEVGTNTTGLALINNARLFNRGRVYAARANEGPGTVGPVEIDIYLEDNSIYYAFAGSFNYCADDVHIRDNAIYFVEIDVCIEIDDDFHLQGLNSILCGEGGASIGVSTVDNDVIFELGASANNICSGLTVFRGVGATCNPTSGTAVVTGTGPTNLRPRAVNDIFNAALNTAINLNVLYQGEDDIDLDGASLEIISAGSNGAINDNLGTAGGSLSINDNGTPSNFSDDYIVYTPLLGFIGEDSFQYIIEDDDGATDTATVSITVGCGSGSITSYNYTYATFESETNDVVDELEAEGAPDGLFAQIYDNNETLVLDFGQVYNAGTQYEITWRRRNTVGTGTAIIDLSESTLPGSGFVIHPISPENTDNINFTTTIVTSNVDFRYLAFDKGNGSTVDYEIDAVGVISSVSCEDDTDEDGIANSIDIDDDNDGIPDNDEGICGISGTIDAFWAMENNTDDISGNNRNAGSGTTTPSFSTDAIQGDFSASFNGTTHQIRYSQDGDFMEASYTLVSFSAWIKPNSLTGTRVIYEEGGGTNGLILWLNGNILTYTARNGGAASQTNLAYSIPLTLDNQWRHIACTFDNGVMNLYLDGVAESVTAAFTVIPSHTSDGGIGGDFSGNSAAITGNYSGLLDAAKYSFNEAWSSTDIAFEAAADCDGDGIPNRLDLDSDNDGIADLVEAGGVDGNGDGRVDVFSDTDADGLANIFDTDNGGTALLNEDTDGDGFINTLDIDSDNDGIVDLIEAQVTTSSPIIPSGADNDNDGVDNSFDVDFGSTFLNPVNTDGTDNLDYLDIDSDNDGYSDFLEAYDVNNDKIPDFINSDEDSDADGLSDSFDNINGINTTTNITNGGQSSSSFPNNDNASTSERDWREIKDSDLDGVPDFFDIDKDNDGIIDSLENICLNPSVVFLASVDAFWALENNANDISGNNRNSGSGTTLPSFVSNAIQGNFAANFNGIDQEIRYSNDANTFMEGDYTQISFSAWIKPTSLSGTRIIYEEGGTTNGSILWLNGNVLTYSTRSGGTQFNLVHPEVLVISDLWNHVACTFDNGLMNIYLNGVVATGTAPFSSIPPHGSDGGIGGDFGGNSAAISGNYSGILDAARYSFTEAWSSERIAFEAQQVCDTDRDGVLNQFDLDSDNDGIADIVEAGGTDTDGDGRVDSSADTDSDGLSDIFDTDNGGVPLTDGDQDGDGISNRNDLDSDNDGISDNVEAQTTAAFAAPSGVDSDGDGIDNTYDIDGGTPIVLSNNDGVGEADYLDLDSDGDGLFDWSEGFDDNNTQDALDDYLLRANAFETAAGFPMFYINSNDIDTDGVPNWAEDDDSDNLPNFLDPNSSFYHDTDQDGIVDLFDTDNGGAISNTPDGDADGEYDFRDSDNLVSLPIELVFFGGEQEGESIRLNWETISEINNDFFTVEKLMEGRFIKIQEVAGAGNSSDRLNYLTYDLRPTEGLNYYRLRQTDYDGSNEVSEIIKVNFTLANQLSFYPNPNSIGKIYFKNIGLKDGSYIFRIVNQYGTLVQENHLQLDDSTFETEISLNENLSKGLYYFQLIGRDQVSISKAIILQ